jgi:hypothetical protein
MNWPSTGSTSSMVLALSNVIDLPTYRWIITEAIIATVAPLGLATAFLFKPRCQSLSSRLTYISFVTLFSGASLLISFEILAIWSESTISSSRVISHSIVTLAIVLTCFHILGYTNMNTTINQYGKPTADHTKFI